MDYVHVKISDSDMMNVEEIMKSTKVNDVSKNKSLAFKNNVMDFRDYVHMKMNEPDVMNLEDIMNSTKIYDVSNDKPISVIDSLTIMVEKDDYHMIRYNCTKKLLILNISMMETDNENRYYIDYVFTRDCDIISNFKFIANDLNVKFSFVCGVDEYKIEDIKEFLSCSTLYQDFKLRITFNDLTSVDKELANKEILLEYSKFLCRSDVRACLMKKTIKTPKITYNQGGAHKNYDNME